MEDNDLKYYVLWTGIIALLIFGVAVLGFLDENLDKILDALK
jgi:hypothetical protein